MKSKIKGVIVRPLSTFTDKRGMVIHMLRNDDPNFTKFGEIYFATVRPNCVKAWHVHALMTLNYACIVGRIKLVLYAPEQGILEEHYLEGSPLFSEYKLITIPPGIWNGFKSEPIQMPNQNAMHFDAIVANCSDRPHDKQEITRIHPDNFNPKYDWGPYLEAG